MTNFRYGNPGFDCAGAHLRAHCRQLATVVAVDGDIDSTNVELVVTQMRRFVLAEKPFVLDLSGVGSFTPQAISLLEAVEQECDIAGVEWSMVTSQPVTRTVRLSGRHGEFPVAGSVADALHRFSDDIDARRRLLPLLTKKTA